MVKLSNSKLYSVQTRLLIVLILTSTLPLLGMGSFFAWNDANIQQEAFEQSQLNFAEITSREINILFQELRDDASLIASLPTITHGTPEERQRLLEQIFQNYGRYGQLAFVDPDSGNILQAGKGIPTQTVNISHIQSFQHAQEGRQSWVVAPPPMGGPLILHMHTPILRDGKIIGILGSPMPIEPIRAIVEQIVSHTNCSAQIADHGGVVFLDTARLPDPNGNEPTWPYREQFAMHAEQSGTFVGNHYGVEELIAYSRVPQLGWTVMVNQSMESILVKARLKRNLTLAGAAIMAMICMLIAYLLSISITVPLRRLSNALAAFGRGRLVEDFRIKSGGIHEYQILSSAFDRMRQNISEREARLARAELENRSIINAIPDSLCRLDCFGTIIGQKLKPPFDTIFQTHGIHAGQSVTDVLDKFALFDDVGTTWIELRDQVRTGQGARMQHLIHTPDGPLHLECQIMAEQDGGYLVIVSDISERKHAEEMLRQAKHAAEDANRAKSSFLSHMTHELRTPMNGVIGMTSLLYDTNLDDDQLELINNIRSSGDALLTIINDILDFSKIEASKFELEKAEFVVSSCIEDALDLVAAHAADKDLALVYEVDESVPHTITQDDTRLRQILVNLLNNAVKFTERGGIEVLVSAEPIEETSLRNGKEREFCLNFVVRDSGIGIPQDRLDRLFRSFSQVDNSTARRYGGTGLGLVISKRLCEMMGGTISVESEAGHGSTFHFSIIAEATPTQAAQPSNLHNPLKSKHVLVVDDNPLSYRYICRYLERWGASVDGWPKSPDTDESRSGTINWADKSNCADIPAVEEKLAQSSKLDAIVWSQPLRTEEEVRLLNKICDKYPHVHLVLCLSHSNRLARQQASSNIKIVAKPIKPMLLLNNLLDEIHQDDSGTDNARGRLPDPNQVNLPGVRILLAEDNIVNQKVAIRILGRYGLKADIAANGLEVLSAMERQTYDIILMDVQMPEMDGLMATRQIRMNQLIDTQPYIIAVTANAMDQDREAYLAQGMDDFVSKPIRIPELIDALRRAADTPQSSPLPVSGLLRHPLPTPQTVRELPMHRRKDMAYGEASPYHRARQEAVRQRP